jgi:uncharacterized membrane protein YgdD (TMEM256/DUF423 family)
MTCRAAAVAAALAGGSAVALGAFGAHALRSALGADALQVWHSAVDYQFWHALALLGAAFAPASRWRSVAVVAFCLGIALFSGSLYALALGAPRLVGAITPFGGLSFILGWVAIGGAFWRTAK